ncbi:MAG: hypothetical protein N2Z69_03020, partial [Methylophilaceae bacterium]|nr:hypothetical protein [Methylophilaceae bacterium]
EQASCRKAPVDAVMAVVEGYRRRHAGWNVKHFYAWYRRDGGSRSYTWVKNALQAAGAVARAAGRGKHRKRRARSAWPEMMLHQDGSTHQWVAGKKWDLIITLDDATSEHYPMFFVEGRRHGLKLSGREGSHRAARVVRLPLHGSVRPQPAPANTIPAMLSEAEAAALHRSGLEAYAAGLAGDDPAAVLAGITLLERAALGIPANSAYWLDLADAYVNSGIALKYPKAIDIYWMLLLEPQANQDALLARLVEAYDRVGNCDAAFSAATERLRRATPEQANQASLQLAMMSLGCDRMGMAAAKLAEKAKTLDRSAYQWLLASALQEAADDPKAAVNAIDQALKQLDANPAAKEMALRERARIAP